MLKGTTQKSLGTTTMSFQFSTTTAYSDETYLESYIESISSTLPAELRRNLDHLRFLDDTSCALIELWRDTQDNCLVNVEELVLGEFKNENYIDDDDKNNNTRVKTTENNLTKAEEDAHSMENVAEQRIINEEEEQQQSSKKRGRSAITVSESDDISPPTSKTRRGRQQESPLQRDSPMNQPQQGAGRRTKMLLSSSSRSPAEEEINPVTVKSGGRSRKSLEVKKMETLQSDDDNSNNDKIVEEEEVVEDGDVIDNDDDDDFNTTQKKGVEQHLPQMLLLSNITQRRPPTIHERIQLALSQSKEYTTQRTDITNMYNKLQQYSNEKLHTAQQIRTLVEMACGRLDRDLELFEQELGIASTATTTLLNNDYLISGGEGALLSQQQQQGMTNTSAMNTIGGGAGSSFLTSSAVDHRLSATPMLMMASAHQASFDTVAASMSLSNIALNNNAHRHSSIVSSRSVLESLSQLPPVPPPNASSSSSSPQQKLPLSTRLPPPSKAIVSTTLAAIQIVPNSDWILAKILAHDRATRTYTLSDEDVQSSDQIYVISDRERRVVPLRNTEHNKWIRGDEVYAVYPDTTSFYPAMVSTPPFNGYVMVQFANDEDGNGITHEKAVLAVHVMKVPPMKAPAK